MDVFSMKSNKQLVLAFESAVENLCIDSTKYKKVRKSTERYYKECKDELLKRLDK